MTRMSTQIPCKTADQLYLSLRDHNGHTYFSTIYFSENLYQPMISNNKYIVQIPEKSDKFCKKKIFSSYKYNNIH